MVWKVEIASLQEGWKTRLIVDSESYDPHPEAMGFVIALSASERSENTIKTYLAAIAVFLTWADAHGIDWRTVNVLELTRYKRHLQEKPTRSAKPRSPATVGLALTAVTEFLRYCAAEGHIDPAVAGRLVERRSIQPRRGAGEKAQFRRTRINALRVNLLEQPPEVFSDEQVDAMRAVATTARDRFMLRMLHDAGPRIGEALGLHTEDMHLLPNSRSLGCAVTGPHFHVYRRPDNENNALAKSKRPRHVPVANTFIEDFRDYQHERFMHFGEQQSAYLFVNYEGPELGQPMTYSNAYKIISRFGRKNGFRATPHMFRHSAATAWVEAGIDVDVVQELLGHASPVSTAIYMHASDSRMREAVTAVHATRGKK